MHKTFIKALSWNSGAIFIYKIALLSHQILLYSVISKTMYGLQSTLFATMYTIIACTDFGFQETLLPFFSTFSQSKQQFRQAWYHFIWQIITSGFIALFLYITMMYGFGEFLHNITMHCNKNIIFLITTIFFIESLKKSIIAMMQLAFLNEQIAYAEIIMLLTYIASVWTIFNWNGLLELYTIFAPMLICSFLELCYLLYHFLGFYNKLPKVTGTSKIPFKVLFKQRIYNYVNQIVKTIYSPNCMTIFFAYFLGFQQAATIKFFTNIITLSYTCISKTIGVTSGAAFSAMNQMPLSHIQSLFKDITIRYFKMLLILSMLLCTVVGYSWYNSMISDIMALQILLFFSIGFLEHVSVTYEQLFISQHAGSLLAIINLVGLVWLGICTYGYVCGIIGQLIILGLFLGVKISSLWIIRFFAHRNWAI